MCLSWQQLYQVFPPVHQILLQFLRRRGPLQVLAVQADWKKAVQIALIVTICKRNWGKVKFLCLSVSHSVNRGRGVYPGGMCIPACTVQTSPLGRQPPGRYPPADTLLGKHPWQTPPGRQPSWTDTPWVDTDV